MAVARSYAEDEEEDTVVVGICSANAAEGSAGERNSEAGVRIVEVEAVVHRVAEAEAGHQRRAPDRAAPVRSP